MTKQSSNLLDLVAEDLSLWIDRIANDLAETMMAGGTAPFSAQLTEQQKLDFYKQALFNPDGTPNLQGRVKEMQRLGAEGFASVFKAVMSANPGLAVPSPPAGAAIPSALPAPQLPYPGRAAGGPVDPWQPYTVGEQGPETFVPSVPGTIVPSPLPAPSVPPPLPTYGTAPAAPTPVPADQAARSRQDPNKARVFGTPQAQATSAVMAEEGKPYSGPLAAVPGPESDRWGAPGWDCSSLVSGIFAQQGVKLTPYTDAAYDETYAPDDPQSGDIIFFKYYDESQPNTTYPHMGIYLGTDESGQGWMTDANYGTGKVTVEPVLNYPYEIRRPTALKPQAPTPMTGGAY